VPIGISITSCSRHAGGDQHSRQSRQSGRKVERNSRPKMLPQLASSDAGRQRHHAADKVEDSQVLFLSLGVTVTEEHQNTAFQVEILVLGVRYRMPGEIDLSTDLFQATVSGTQLGGVDTGRVLTFPKIFPPGDYY
jgi:hypothetical protein